MMINKYKLKTMLLLSIMTMGTSAFAQKIPANNIQAVDGTYHTNANGIGLTYTGNLNNLKFDDNTSVKLTSANILIGGVMPSSLEFSYINSIPANKPYYFRLSNTSGFSGVLLGG